MTLFLKVVKIIDCLSDANLELLYERGLFTVYPSSNSFRLS